MAPLLNVNSRGNTQPDLDNNMPRGRPRRASNAASKAATESTVRVAGPFRKQHTGGLYDIKSHIKSHRTKLHLVNKPSSVCDAHHDKSLHNQIQQKPTTTTDALVEAPLSATPLVSSTSYGIDYFASTARAQPPNAVTTDNLAVDLEAMGDARAVLADLPVKHHNEKEALRCRLEEQFPVWAFQMRYMGV